MTDKHLQITVTTEVHHELTIRVEDYIDGEFTVQKHLELYANVRDNPMGYINKSNESTSEEGDIRHSRVEHLDI